LILYNGNTRKKFYKLFNQKKEKFHFSIFIIFSRINQNIIMKKFILLFITGLIFPVLLFSQSLTTSYINGYKILQGERPAINVRDFPADAYQQGKINIKIDRSHEMLLPAVQHIAGFESFVITGISNLDHLNSQFQAQSYTPLFGMLYETNSRTSNFNERHRAWGLHLWFTIELGENVSIANAVDAYQALHFVEIAEPVYNIVLHGADKITRWTPNDPRINEQWHYKNTGQVGGTPGCDISLFEAWEMEKGNSDVIVSVVDCGIRAAHPDLEANMWSQIGYNFFQNTATISPGDHGCHTGGTVAAVSNNGVGVAGVAGGSGSGDGVRLMTCQVFNSAGSSGGGFENAYVYAADNGACISQNSWGYTSPNSYNQSVLTAIDYFIANGGGEVMEDGIVIFASGNNNNYPYNGLEGNYYPGCYAPVFGVTATNNQDKKASYAHYGTWVSLSAPGGETNSVTARGVLSCTVNGYSFFQGTSMACPHVSGAAALLASYATRNGYILTSQEVKNLLMDNVDDHYHINPTLIGKLGTGRLNAHKALLALDEMLLRNPHDVGATPKSSTEIELKWVKNIDNNEVMILTNTKAEFSVPKNGTSYQVGDTLPQGGVVLYIGDVEMLLHSGLKTNSKHYYKLFSSDENYRYSKGIMCEATTFCGIFENPLFEGFEEGINFCWEQESVTGEMLWLEGKGNGSDNPEEAFEGESNIYLKMNTISDIGKETRLILPPINMAGFNNVKLSFAYYNQSRSGLADELTIYYKTAASGDWKLWQTYKQNQDSWLVDTIVLFPVYPGNNDVGEFYVCFHGKIKGGFGICLDNILIEGFIMPVGVKENVVGDRITVYPNPTTGELRITNRSPVRGELSEANYESRITSIEIFDINGKNAETKPSNSLEGWLPQADGVVINISHLPDGIFFLRINGGEAIKVIKRQ
jgi:subtilisin family serine protease